MKSAYKILLVEVAILAVVSSIFYFWEGPALAIIFSLIWIDKALIPLLRFAGYFGFELATVPIILIGIAYGPVFGFFFAFLIVAAIGGILNIIIWRIVPPEDIGWPPLVPSLDHLVDGITAAVAGILSTIFPFIAVVLFSVLVKNFMVATKQQYTEGYVNYFERFMNIGINFAMVWIFQNYLLAIIVL